LLDRGTGRVDSFCPGPVIHSRQCSDLAMARDGNTVAFWSDVDGHGSHVGANAARPFQQIAPNDTITGGGVAISRHGRRVAFDDDIRLDLQESGPWRDIHVHDRLTGRTRRVCLDPLGGEAEGDSQRPDKTDDGTLIAFESTAPDLVPGDDNGTVDVFVAGRPAPCRRA
jgi:hypothetical protein